MKKINYKKSPLATQADLTDMANMIINTTNDLICQQNEKISSLDKKVSGLDVKFNSLNERINSLDKKVSGLDVKFNSLDKVVGRIEKNIEKQLDLSLKIIKEIREMRKEITFINHRQSIHSNKLENYNDRIVNLENKLAHV